MSTKGAGGVRRIGWGVGDQALSSFSNFAMSLLIARSVSPQEFGAFGIAFATYTVALGASRAIAGEPLVVRFSSVPERRWRRGASTAGGTALALGATAGAACVIAGTLTRGALGGALTILGIALPGLMVQDLWRYSLFAAKRPAAAFANDLIWTVLQLAAIAALLLAGVRSVPHLLAAWGGAATVAALAGMVQTRTAPRPAAARRWLADQRELASRYLAEFGARNGTQAGVVYATGGLAGLAQAGALRAGQVALGLPHVLNMGLTGVSIPEALRHLERSPDDLIRFTRKVSLGIALPTLLWGSLLLLLPTGIGEAILGRAWERALSVLIPLTLAQAAAGAQTGATVGLRALADARRSLRARLGTAIFALGAGVLGAWAWGAVGAASGLALGLGIGAVFFWFALIAAVRDYESKPVAERPARTPALS